MSLPREKWLLLAFLVLAAGACVLGALAPPTYSPSLPAAEEALDLVRVLLTTFLTVTLLLGPGLALRAFGVPGINFAVLPLPGLVLLIAAGGLSWLMAPEISAQTVCVAFLAPILGLMFGSLISYQGPSLFRKGEASALVALALVLGLVVGRALWSMAPPGELFAGTISHNLIEEGRPDSRIPFFLSQLVAHGTTPFSEVAQSYFGPYNFSSRGPLAGLATAPIVFLSGAHPPVELPEQPWSPFDPQGFMAFRIAMPIISLTALMTLWELVRRFRGKKAAHFAIVIAASTPFLLHELWYTWPKLIAASFILLAAILLLERRPFLAGLSIGIGYLMHPSALIGISAIGLIALWPLKNAEWRRPKVTTALVLALGTLLGVLAWRYINGSNYMQGDFLAYIGDAGYNYYPTLGEWVKYRIESLSNTLVPLSLPVLFSDNISINTWGGTSPPVIHFFFQYWNGIPFGFALAFFPLLVQSLYRSWKLWPWPVLSIVLFPFAAFTIYWGASSSGMLREGLQFWVLAVLALIAVQQATDDYPWFRSKVIRILLSLRAVECLALAIVPTVITNHMQMLAQDFRLTDLASLLLMSGSAAGLLVLTWRTSRPEGSSVDSVSYGRANVAVGADHH